MKFPPASEKAAFADALKLERAPFEITIPGLEVLPRIRLRLLLPNVKFALPLIERFDPAETYFTVSEFAVKFPPASEKAAFADALKLERAPFEITIPGLDVLPRIKLRLLVPNVKFAFPLIERFDPAET